MRFIPMTTPKLNGTVTMGKVMAEEVWLSLTCLFLPMFIMCLLYGVRKKHPVNLVVFTVFTVSFGACLGILTAYLESDIFIVAGISCLVFTFSLMLLCLKVPSKKMTCWHFSLPALLF